MRPSVSAATARWPSPWTHHVRSVATISKPRGPLLACRFPSRWPPLPVPRDRAASRSARHPCSRDSCPLAGSRPLAPPFVGLRPGCWFQPRLVARCLARREPLRLLGLVACPCGCLAWSHALAAAWPRRAWPGRMPLRLLGLVVLLDARFHAVCVVIAPSALLAKHARRRLRRLRCVRGMHSAVCVAALCARPAWCRLRRCLRDRNRAAPRWAVVVPSPSRRRRRRPRRHRRRLRRCRAVVCSHAFRWCVNVRPSRVFILPSRARAAMQRARPN